MTRQRKWIIFAVLVQQVVAGNLFDKTQIFIKTYFGPDVRLEQRNILIPTNIKSQIEKKSRQRFFREKINSWHIMRGDSSVGYALLDNVYGKTAPITFVVLFDTAGIIQSSVVIKYREPYGGQVQNKGWLSQFNGRGQSATNNVGQDVSAISGATISVNSMARGMQKLILLFPFIRKSFENPKG